MEALLELGEDLLGLLPEAAGEEGPSAELDVDPLLELGIGVGDLGVGGHEEAGCGGRSGFAAGDPVGEAHELLARPLADDDLVEEGSVEGSVNRVEGARVDVRDGDETLELLVLEQGAGEGGCGPTKLVGQLGLFGEEELDVLGQGRALLGRLLLQIQLDERVDVARNDFVGDGIDEGPSSSCERMKMPVRDLWSLE